MFSTPLNSPGPPARLGFARFFRTCAKMFVHVAVAARNLSSTPRAIALFFSGAPCKCLGGGSRYVVIQPYRHYVIRCIFDAWKILMTHNHCLVVTLPAAARSHRARTGGARLRQNTARYEAGSGAQTSV